MVVFFVFPRSLMGRYTSKVLQFSISDTTTLLGMDYKVPSYSEIKLDIL